MLLLSLMRKVHTVHTYNVPWGKIGREKWMGWEESGLLFCGVLLYSTVQGGSAHPVLTRVTRCLSLGSSERGEPEEVPHP